VRGVDLHDVPQDGLAADLDHRLRLEVGLLRDPGTETACQDNGFDSLFLSTTLA
jgi:hypothetical protein